MDIIWITDECPYPANTGGRVGVWKRIEYMSYRNNIYLFTIIDDADEKKYIDSIRKWCKDVYMYERNSKIKILFQLFRYPYPAVSRWNKNMKEDIEKLSESLNPDYILVDGPHMMGVLSNKVINNQQVVLNQHNIEHLSLKSIGIDTYNPIKKILYTITSYKMEKYEKKVYNDKIILYTFVSSTDKKYFEQKYNKKNTLLVPVGAELNFDLIYNNRHIMIFVAKMSYQSNEDGAIWLLNNVWEKVLEKVPDANLYLVGKNPSEKLRSLAKEHKGVIVTGTVDDLEKYYAKTNLVVVPIFSGGGVKVKLLEALGYGKIVVTTKKGIEGTKFKNKKHLIATENSNVFAKECISIMNNPKKYEVMQKNVIQLMTEEYSWKSIINAFEYKLALIKGKNL